MLQQVPQYHVSILGSNNGPDPNTDPTSYAQGLKTMGYRYQLDTLTLPATITQSSAFTVSSAWENVNVAPIYLPMNVMVQLRTSAGGTVAWQAQSSRDLRTLLPTGGSRVTTTDTFTVPNTVSPGTYTVSVQVLDPAGVSVPLRLAISGREGDGSYTLGTVTVQSPLGICAFDSSTYDNCTLGNANTVTGSDS
jgi:hypothetical protein